MSEIIDIVALVNNNPLKKLTNNDNNSDLVSKIKEKFNTDEEKLFLVNFYCYLKYDPDNDFIIDLGKIWKWLGYSRIEDCKRVLIKESNNFKENKDYIIQKSDENYFPQIGGKKNNSKIKEENIKKETRGRKPDITLLTINCFKRLCMKSRTDKADQIHEYYIKLENVLTEMFYVQNKQLNLELTNSNKQLKNTINQKEQNILSNFHKKKIVYLGYTEENVLKFGFTDKIRDRLSEHKFDIKPDFTYEYVYESVYNPELERRMKKHPIISAKIIKKIYGTKPQTELIQLNEYFTIQDLDKIILEIKKQVELGEFDAMQKEILDLETENSDLKLQIEKLKKDDSIKFQELTNENKKLKLKIDDYEEKCDEFDSKLINIQQNSMDNLHKKFQEIKKFVCYNFLIDMIAKEIILRNNQIGFIIKLSVDEIFEKYKQYIFSNKFKEPLYRNETDEKRLLTTIFDTIDGIYNTYVSNNKITLRAKFFYVDKITEWICKNIQVPSRFRNLFREISKNVVFDKYPIIINKDITEFKYKTTYSFLIFLITKYKDKEKGKDIIVIKDIIVTEEYLKFMLQFGEKLRISELRSILCGIPGIKRKEHIKEDGHDYLKGLQFNLKEITEWIENTLEYKYEDDSTDDTKNKNKN
jgi:phage anti-repressor protein